MKFSMTAPCAKCPFRTDVRPYLHPARAREIADSLTRQQQTFPCHATLDYDTADEDGEPHVSPNAEHCAGALIMLEAMNRPSQMMRIAERMGLYNYKKLAKDAPVFAHARDFVVAQAHESATNGRRGSARPSKQHKPTPRGRKS